MSKLSYYVLYIVKKNANETFTESCDVVATRCSALKWMHWMKHINLQEIMETCKFKSVLIAEHIQLSAF